jgi:hypothetical protein
MENAEPEDGWADGGAVLARWRSSEVEISSGRKGKCQPNFVCFRLFRVPSLHNIPSTSYMRTSNIEHET